MQLESKDIYRLTSEEHGIDQALVKSVGDAVFQSLYKTSRNPPNLILAIRGLGRRFVRKAKVEQWIEMNNARRSAIERGIQRPGLGLEEMAEEKAILLRLLDQYQVYLAEKQRKTALKNEFKKAVESGIPAKTLREASKNNQGKRKGVPPREPEGIPDQDRHPEATTGN